MKIVYFVQAITRFPLNFISFFSLRVHTLYVYVFIADRPVLGKLVFLCVRRQVYRIPTIIINSRNYTHTHTHLIAQGTQLSNLQNKNIAGKVLYIFDTFWTYFPLS